MTTYEGAAAAPRTDLAKHPAVVAWRELYSGTALPADVQSLRKQNVLRLIGAGPQRSNVIAKRCRNDRMVENHVYENILPQLRVSSPAYYGHVKESRDGSYWLFIEDAGKEKYSPSTREHQTLVSSWLAELHTSASHLQRPRLLPDRDSDFFLEHLRFIRSTINLRRPMWANLGDGASAFEKLLSQCDVLESRWGEVQSACECAPSTLVHCDFTPKNICVRSSHRGKVLLPFDWEVAGWGNPATDIAHLIPTPGTSQSKSHLVVGARNGIEAYWRTVRGHWPQLSLEFFERLALVGQIFRMLLSVGWALEDPLPSGERIVAIALIDEEQALMYNRATKEPSRNWLLSVLPLYESRLGGMLSSL